MTWTVCNNDKPVFTGGIWQDHTLDDLPTASPKFGQVIDRIVAQGGKAVINHGQLDMLLKTEDTLVGIQNVTWGEVQGFEDR